MAAGRKSGSEKVAASRHRGAANQTAAGRGSSAAAGAGGASMQMAVVGVALEVAPQPGRCPPLGPGVAATAATNRTIILT